MAPPANNKRLLPEGLTGPVQKMAFKPRNTRGNPAGVPPPVLPAAGGRTGATAASGRETTSLAPARADPGKAKASKPAKPSTALRVTADPKATPVKAAGVSAQQAAAKWAEAAAAQTFEKAEPPKESTAQGDKSLSSIITASKIKIPSTNPETSPFELRIFNLRHLRTGDSIDHAHEILRHINEVNKEVLRPGNAEYIDAALFDVLEGEPQLNGKAAAFQPTARIIYSATARQNGQGYDIGIMDKLRIRLISKAFEAYWSCGNKVDRRSVGDFYFEKEEGREKDDITEDTATAFLRDLLSPLKLAQPTVSFYGSFDFSRCRGMRHERHVKFLHPALVQQVAELSQGRTWKVAGENGSPGYIVSYEPATNVLFPTNPCSIAVWGAGQLAETSILAELWEWVAEYNEQYSANEGLLKDGRRAHGKWFIVTPTSFSLSAYLCSKMPRLLPPWQFVYDLNVAETKIMAEQNAEQARRKVEQEQKIAEAQAEALEEVKSLRARLDRKDDQNEAMWGYVLRYTNAQSEFSAKQTQWIGERLDHGASLASVESDIKYAQGRVDTLKRDVNHAERDVAFPGRHDMHETHAYREGG